MCPLVLPPLTFITPGIILCIWSTLRLTHANPFRFFLSPQLQHHSATLQSRRPLLGNVLQPTQRLQTLHWKSQGPPSSFLTPQPTSFQSFPARAPRTYTYRQHQFSNLPHLPGHQLSSGTWIFAKMTAAATPFHLKPRLPAPLTLSMATHSGIFHASYSLVSLLHSREAGSLTGLETA